MLVLYNTLTRKKENFRPISGRKVGIYTCGITAYFYPHIGNMLKYIRDDVLRRLLIHDGYTVRHVENVTDVGHLASDADTGDDKMRKEAGLEHRSMKEIAEHYTNIFLDYSKELNILVPNKMPRASEHVGEMLKLLDKLDEKGYLYTAPTGVYFDTSKFPTYGQLTGMSFERLNRELREGARVEKVEGKRNLTDFAVWRFAHGNETDMIWDSKWGRGFPGWHLECSTMSMEYLGERYDIHTGGKDHIQIHHTDEIAQSESATGHKVVNYWIHWGFLTVDGGKMAKSLRNIYTIGDLRDKGYNPLAFRLFVISGHARQDMNFTFEALGNAANTLNGVHLFLERLAGTSSGKPNDDTREFLRSAKEFREAFFRELDDDINTPEALAQLHGLIRLANPRMASGRLNMEEAEAVTKMMLEMDEVLGLGFKEYAKKRKQSLGGEIRALIEERERARKAKDFARADELRARLRARYHVILEDTKEGVGWRMEKPAG